MPADGLAALEKRRSELKAKLAEIGDMRPGSLVERYRRCGKATCHCAGKGSAGHGPSWSLTREVAGKTVTRVVPVTAVAQTRAQVAEHRRFRELVRDLVDASERVCDAKLQPPEAASEAEAAKKGGSKRRSRPRSSPRLKRS